jgi:uncharacterized protein YcgI (DUF1989 family)
VRNWGIRLGVGSQLVSNRDNVMFTIRQDTVGVHDIMFCLPSTFTSTCSASVRATCFGAWQQPLEAGIPDDLPIRLTLLNTASGQREIYVPLRRRKGDFIELVAEMDCLVAVSACADDVTECNHGKCSRIALRVV